MTVLTLPSGRTVVYTAVFVVELCLVLLSVDEESVELLREVVLVGRLVLGVGVGSDVEDGVVTVGLPPGCEVSLVDEVGGTFVYEVMARK